MTNPTPQPNNTTPAEGKDGLVSSAPAPRARTPRASQPKHAAAKSRVLAAGGAGGAVLLMMGVMAANAQTSAVAVPEQPATRQIVVVAQPAATQGATTAVAAAEPTQIFIAEAPAAPTETAPVQAVAVTEGS